MGERRYRQVPRVFQHDRNVARERDGRHSSLGFLDKTVPDRSTFSLGFPPLSTVDNDAPLEAPPGRCMPCYGSKTGHGVLCELRQKMTSELLTHEE